jgi:ornithine cyclodeaminase/alanine dehydrogenase-like protein (mu-crystallin family)
VIVTCTPSHEPLLDIDHVRPGTFLAGVGADNEEKHELAPSLLASATVVVDVLAQCERMGDLHHAIAAGVMTRDDVHAELGAVLVGHAPGRRSSDEVIVFDSTGMALQDVAAAAVVYERALAGGGLEPAR